MELLDRYLQAVKKHLPWERQDDIFAELKANLESQLEDKEAELGRKLTDTEMKTWLKQLGSPLMVAARYRPQRYLIGPALFPIYWFVLRLALGWCAVIYAIANVVEIVMSVSGADGIVRAVAHLPGALFMSAAMVTLIFVVIEMAGARCPEKLQPFMKMNSAWQQGMVSPLDAPDAIDRRKKNRTFATAIAEAIFGWIVLAWLLAVPHYPFLLMGPGVIYLKLTPYQLAPVWWTFYWCVVGLNALQLAWKMVDLWSGAWQRPRRAQKLVMHIAGLVPIFVVLAAPRQMLLVLKNPEDTIHGAALPQINEGIYRGFEVVAAIVIMQLIWSIGRMGVDAYRKRLAAR
jgi:hypothetical protein